MYDLIIVGAGPAGITAAIYAARKRMDFLVLTLNVGGQVTFSSTIENYTGFQYITGEELTAKFYDHLKQYNFDLRIEEALRVSFENGFFHVTTDNGDYSSRTVIVATGRRPRELNVPGEREFKNRGVSYCATCDAPLFRGVDVAVVGGGNSGLEAVLQLMKIANNVYLIEIMHELKADPILVEKAKTSSRVSMWTGTRVLEIVGDKVVKGMKILKEGEELFLPVQGVFIEVGSTPNSEIVDFVEKNQWGEIIVNCTCETSFPGLFAAGDVTNVPEKQIVVAAGEGCKAALSAFRYLSRIRQV
ncbi:FAD-dependent oxidoreductase [Candidatus Bathyarchaeota archaeon]|nr:FAD-dependent oxidoreductase [Candidatus Bathyarchaeota archaeon]MBS7613140.1 FAD-dependent oxidoreductase [Candidatus Bathyarchaeota archaeon]MBS7617507.1 FAD-dependent oxidoreductase [Candidatus Bathyarchaeota archaeon]